MIHASGLIHIGGTAYSVWADPPNCGCTAQRHVEDHSRTTSAFTTLKPLNLPYRHAYGMLSKL